jgi:hypothetical protein
VRRVARDALSLGAVAQALAIGGLLALAALRGGDPQVVAVTRARAAAEPLDAPSWLDHAQAAQRLRPWQPGFGAARAELDAIDRARASALVR